jgi:hypothetical protein
MLHRRHCGVDNAIDEAQAARERPHMFKFWPSLGPLMGKSATGDKGRFDNHN